MTSRPVLHYATPVRAYGPPRVRRRRQTAVARVLILLAVLGMLVLFFWPAISR